MNVRVCLINLIPKSSYNIFMVQGSITQAKLRYVKLYVFQICNTFPNIFVYNMWHISSLNHLIFFTWPSAQCFNCSMFKLTVSYFILKIWKVKNQIKSFWTTWWRGLVKFSMGNTIFLSFFSLMDSTLWLWKILFGSKIHKIISPGKKFCSFIQHCVNMVLKDGIDMFSQGLKRNLIKKIDQTVL